MTDEPSDRRAIPAELARYAVRPKRLAQGNQLELLRGGGEAFPAMLEAIAAAKTCVCLETYILSDDGTGQQFADALSERARHGVAVRLLYDSIGSLGLSRTYLRGLRESGVETLEYHPVAPWKPRFGINRRDHRKILVVDHRLAFTGGLNISDEYRPASEGGDGWYDLHCRVRGPIVGDLARLFRRVWVREGGSHFQVPRHVPRIEGGSLARVISNRKFRQRRKIRRAYLYAINRARETIFLKNAYFIPDRGIRRALRKAVKRGVRVRVIVPENSDVPITLYAGQYLFARLLRHGIELLAWPETMMHAKTAVIDCTWSAIGSYNLDNRSLQYNLEVLLEIIDRGFAARLHREFELNAAPCQRLTLELWESRPWWKKALSWLAYRFRRWL